MADASKPASLMAMRIGPRHRVRMLPRTSSISLLLRVMSWEGKFTLVLWAFDSRIFAASISSSRSASSWGGGKSLYLSVTCDLSRSSMSRPPSSSCPAVQSSPQTRLSPSCTTCRTVTSSVPAPKSKAEYYCLPVDLKAVLDRGGGRLGDCVYRREPGLLRCLDDRSRTDLLVVGWDADDGFLKGSAKQRIQTLILGILLDLSQNGFEDMRRRKAFVRDPNQDAVVRAPFDLVFEPVRCSAIDGRLIRDAYQSLDAPDDKLRIQDPCVLRLPPNAQLEPAASNWTNDGKFFPCGRSTAFAANHDGVTVDCDCCT